MKEQGIWAPSGTPDLPWYPEWAVNAACRGAWSQVEGRDIFFDFPAGSWETRAAKNICYGCPVRMKCLKENLEVPYGIFGGYTEKERRRLRGDKRDRTSIIGYFSQFVRAG